MQSEAPVTVAGSRRHADERRGITNVPDDNTARPDSGILLATTPAGPIHTVPVTPGDNANAGTIPEIDELHQQVARWSQFEATHARLYAACLLERDRLQDRRQSFPVTGEHKLIVQRADVVLLSTVPHSTHEAAVARQAVVTQEVTKTVEKVGEHLQRLKSKLAVTETGATHWRERLRSPSRHHTSLYAQHPDHTLANFQAANPLRAPAATSTDSHTQARPRAQLHEEIDWPFRTPAAHNTDAHRNESSDARRDQGPRLKRPRQDPKTDTAHHQQNSAPEHSPDSDYRAARSAGDRAAATGGTSTDSDTWSIWSSLANKWVRARTRQELHKVQRINEQRTTVRSTATLEANRLLPRADAEPVTFEPSRPLRRKRTAPPIRFCATLASSDRGLVALAAGLTPRQRCGLAHLILDLAQPPTHLTVVESAADLYEDVWDSAGLYPEEHHDGAHTRTDDTATTAAARHSDHFILPTPTEIRQTQAALKQAEAYASAEAHQHQQQAHHAEVLKRIDWERAARAHETAASSPPQHLRAGQAGSPGLE